MRSAARPAGSTAAWSSSCAAAARSSRGCADPSVSASNSARWRRASPYARLVAGMRSSAARASSRRPAAAARRARPNWAGATYAASVRAHTAYIRAATSGSPASSHARASASFGASSPGSWPYTALNAQTAAGVSPACSAASPAATRRASPTGRRRGSASAIVGAVLRLAGCQRRVRHWPIATPTVARAPTTTPAIGRPGSSAVTVASHDGHRVARVDRDHAAGRPTSSRSPATAGVSNRRDGVLRVTAPAAVDAVTSRSTPSSCSRISSARLEPVLGRGAVPFSSQRYSESCSANIGTSSGVGSESTYVALVALELEDQHGQRARDRVDVAGDRRAVARHLGRLEADRAVDRRLRRRRSAARRRGRSASRRRRPG